MKFTVGFPVRTVARVSLLISGEVHLIVFYSVDGGSITSYSNMAKCILYVCYKAIHNMMLTHIVVSVMCGHFVNII